MAGALDSYGVRSFSFPIAGSMVLQQPPQAVRALADAPRRRNARTGGPLFPVGLDSSTPPNLFLFDDEGLGHTASSVSSISTRITQRFESVDMILLVDNAQQPMQAAPLSLLRAVGSGGLANKLAVAFTHFDQVRGANLSFEQKREHVLASIRNAISTLRDSVGAGVAGALDRQLGRRSVFLGGLDRATDKLPTGFRREAASLLEMMRKAATQIPAAECQPI